MVEETTIQQVPATIHRRNGSRVFAAEASVANITAANDTDAARSDVAPAIQRGLVRAESWKKPQAIVTTPASCSQNTHRTSPGRPSVPPTKRGSTWQATPMMKSAMNPKTCT